MVSVVGDSYFIEHALHTLHGLDRSAWEIDYKSSISETRKVSHMHIVIYMC